MLKIKQKMISIFIALAVLLVTVTMGLASVFATPTPVLAAETSYEETSFGEGKLLITTTFNGSTYYLPATTTSSSPKAEVFTDVNSISKDHLWTITASGSNYYIQNAEDNYLYATNTNNGIRVGGTKGTWTYDADANSFKFTTLTRHLGIYNAQDWRCYDSVTASNYKESSTSFKFYKVAESGETPDSGSSSEDSSTEPACEHTNTTTTTTDATCTKAGSTVVTCDDCGETVSTEEISATGHNYVDGVCSVCGEEPSSNITAITFEFGANGSASHVDGNDLGTSKTYTEGDYTLALTGMSKVYGPAYDAKGNSCIKLGTSSAVGSFSFMVPNDVQQVIIKVAAYKTTNAKITVNGVSYIVSTASNNGAYTDITVDTSITKTVSFTTVSGGARAMINSITYGIDNSMADCAHETTELHNNENGTHTLICVDCENPQGEAEPCTAENYGEYTSNNNSTHTQTGICDCGATITKTEACSFGEIVTPPTQTEQGYTTYTCENCGYSYQDDFMPALGVETFTVTYYANGNTDEQKYEQNSTITLPTADTETANDGFVFIGWTTEQYNAQTAPEALLKAGDNFLIDDNKTLYAVYEKNIYGLVTDAANLAAGDKVVIAAKDDSVALSTTQNSNNRPQATITKNGDTITFGNDVQVITLELGTVDGTFAFKVDDGYLYAASSGSNHLKTKAELDENGSWKIEIKESVATIKAQGEYTRNWLRYNSTSSLFSCYGSGQKDICLYKQETLYTTAPPKIDTASITVGESLSMNYYVILPDAYSSATMRFTLDGKTVENINGEKQTDGRYKFTFVNIPPQCIAENITAAVVYNGSEIAKLENYSIATYVNNQLEKIKDSTEDKDAKLRNLLNSILAYGEAAKNYCAENGSQGASEIPESANVFNIIKADVDSYGAWFTGANLLFDYDNKICVTLSSTENVTLRVKINDGEYTDYTPKSTAFLTDGILPTAFDSVYTFELYYDGVLMQTLTYSVNSYAYKMQQNTKIGALCVALYNYGVAAEAYQA